MRGADRGRVCAGTAISCIYFCFPLRFIASRSFKIINVWPKRAFPTNKIVLSAETILCMNEWTESVLALEPWNHFWGFVLAFIFLQIRMIGQLSRYNLTLSEVFFSLSLSHFFFSALFGILFACLDSVVFWSIETKFFDVWRHGSFGWLRRRVSFLESFLALARSSFLFYTKSCPKMLCIVRAKRNSRPITIIMIIKYIYKYSIYYL